MESILMNTPFANTIPISAPILKLIKTRASRPTTVVMALLAIEEAAPVMASFIASVFSFPSFCSSRYRLINMME